MRRQILHRLKHGHPQAPMRPAIWADSTDDQRSGLRAIEAHWASTAAGAGSSQHSLGKRRRGEPDPSSHAAWMRPPPKRPPPWRDRPRSQASAPAPRTPPQYCPPDTVDAAATARGPQPPWAHAWRVIDASHLDRGQRVTVWRLLHGKLFVGAFTRHIHRSQAGYTCPHPQCAQQVATLTHVFITCPLAATVWGWFAATWAAITGAAPPPLSADLLLADDQRTWQPGPQLGPLWHRLRLATICQLWASYQRARHQQGTVESAGVVAARILSSCRKAILGDWRLATVTVRTASGVLSDWLRGRDPKLTREEFTARWCHRNILCATGEGPEAQLLIPWSAQHPVPLPA